MTTYETPYGTVDAPTLEAAQKFIANQKAKAGGGAPAASATAADQKPVAAEDKGILQRLWEGIQGRDVSRMGRVGMGIGDPFYGGAQLGARMGPEIGEATFADPAETERRKQSVDRQVQEREQRYEAGEKAAGLSGGLSSEWARMLGGAAGSAPLAAAIPGGGMAGSVGTRLALGGLGGALGGAAQPVSNVQNFGREKALQMGGGALLGAGTAGLFGRAPPNLAAGQRLQDFQSLGVRPNMPVIGQGRMTGLTAQAGRAIPFSPVESGFKQTLADTAQAAERQAGQFGGAETPEEAGRIVQNSVRGYAANKQQAESDYGTFWRLMHGAPPVQMTNTTNLLREMMGRFPNAPGLKGLFTNSKLTRLAEELEPRTETVPGQTSMVLNQFGQPSIVRPPQTLQRGGALSMPELKELRTQIGYMMDTPSFRPDDIPRAQVKRLYGALTQDMRGAAALRGNPEASRALSRATINYGMRQRVLDRLDGLLSANSPESVYSSLEAAARGTGKGGDIGLLQTAQKVMKPEEWNDVGAAMIRRLGNPTPGATRMPGQLDFSINSYATNWNKLTGHAKDVLFGPDEPGTKRAGLEMLARVVNAQKAVGSLANVSHTQQVATAAGLVGELLSAIMRGSFKEMAGVTGVTGGAWGVAKTLMSPGFTRWMYQLPKITSEATTRPEKLQAAGNALLRYLKQTAPTEAGATFAPVRETVH